MIRLFMVAAGLLAAGAARAAGPWPDPDMTLRPGGERALLIDLLRTPGAEMAAVHLVRSNADRLLRFVREVEAGSIREPHRLLVEAELAFQAGDREGARDGFRRAARAYRQWAVPRAVWAADVEARIRRLE